MLIRMATPTHIPAIMGLISRVVPLMQAEGNYQWDAHYPNAQVYANDIARGQLWVAELDGNLAGVAAITTDQEPEYAQVGWDIAQPAVVTHRLAVDPSLRGKGVAGALLGQAERVARQRGILLLRIDTNTQNQTTQKLFPRLGYAFAGKIGLGFRPGLQFYCYQKQLEP
jgi:GNAT superfamily N-acetyltransferase